MSEPTKPILVTAASSYIGSHVVALLLSRNHHVRGTARDPSSSKLAPLHKLPNAQNLTLVQADLLRPETFPQLLSGCSALIHVATPLYYPADGEPLFSTLEEANEKQVKPAVEGTRELLLAAAHAGVRKVVLTSSVAAMSNSPSPRDVMDEKAWSDEAFIRSDQLQNPLGSYRLAKTLQERLAWEMAETLGLKLVTINPVFVCGPSMLGSLNASLEIFLTLAQGKGASPTRCKEATIPNASIWIADVREVAMAHVLAVEKDVGGRFFLCGHAVHCQDVMRVLRENQAFRKLPELPVDDSPLKGKGRFDNSKVRELGVAEIAWEDTVRESAKALADWGHV